MKFFVILSLVLLVACTCPIYPYHTPTPEVTATPFPYPSPERLEIGHTAYPAPGEFSQILDNPTVINAPTCANNIEYPSRIWMLSTAPDNMYSEICISSLMAGSSLVLTDQNTGDVITLSGKRIGTFPPNNCQRYIYDLVTNGMWWAQALVSDPGGVILCSTSPNTFERNRHLFIEMWKP